jgi:hypothetical protein
MPFDLIIESLGLIFVVLGAFLFLVFTLLIRQGLTPTLRPLRGYDSLHDQVGQAVESGGRMHVSLGPNGLVGEKTGVTLAGLAVLDIAAESSVISDLPPVATTADATALPVISDTILRAYRRNDALEKFEQKAARLAAFDSTTLAASATSIIADDDVRANVLVGSFGPEVALMAEAGIRRQIPQTVGSDRIDGQATAYVMADHALIGEEIFVARGYLTARPSAVASVATQDVLRWVAIGLIVAGAVLKTLGLLG